MSNNRSWIRLLAILCPLISCLPPAVGAVIISEFMTANSQSLADDEGDHPDWIELYNTGSIAVNLGGWFLTDDPARLSRWQFPSTILLPEQHLIVFASNKNRRVVGRPLHTNFRLASDAGYLALVEPDGTTVAFSYGPDYPRQVSDISFGTPVKRDRLDLVSTHSTARLLIPSNDLLQSAWQRLDTDDSAWLTVTNGVGFEMSANQPEATLIADSAVDFSGIQGEQGWIYGYYNKSIDISTGYKTNEFVPFPTGIGPVGPVNGWDGNKWRLRDRSTAKTELGQELTQPSGEASGGSELWTIRRWICPANARLRITARIQKETKDGTGVTFIFQHKNSVVETLLISGTNTAPMEKIYELTAEQGDSIDFIVTPIGVSKAKDDIGDALRTRFQIEALANLDSLIVSPIADRMHPRQATAWLRYAFTVNNPAPLHRLLLRMRFDDGFVAWLNGVEVAHANAPANLEWNSHATTHTTDYAAGQPVEWDLTSKIGLLKPGPNLLAIQGLNVTGEDPDFLIAAELEATTLTLDPSRRLYFLPPTPGVANGLGTTNLGPLLFDPSHMPGEPKTNDYLSISIRVTPTFHPIASVSLTWRIMFSNEVSVAMFDDGLHADGVMGDGVYGATVVPSTAAAGEMIRWYVKAVDADGNAMRWPPFADPTASAEYDGTIFFNPSLTNFLPVLHWFMKTTNGADRGSALCSLFYRGKFYDNVTASLHGESSRAFPKKSYNMDMNPGQKFVYDPLQRAVNDFNILTTYPDKAHVRNIIAYETHRNAGSTYHIAFPLRVQLNAAFHGDFHWIEDGDEDYLQRLGLDPRGSLYKMQDSFVGTFGAQKKTRQFEDKSDLQAAVQEVGPAISTRRTWIWDNVNIPAMVNYLAAMIITGGTDCCAKNYYAYRDSEGTGEWQFTPWDLDLTFGRNYTGSGGYADDTMYTEDGLYAGGSNLLIDACFSDASFKQMYLRRVRTLMDQLLQPTNTPPANFRFEQRIAELYSLIQPDADADFSKWPTWGNKQTMAQAVTILTNNYFPRRRRFLYRQTEIPAAQSASPTILFGAFEVTPPSGNTRQEYLQLRNTNSVAIDISGWRLTGGIQHTLAPGTVIPANGSLYITPDVVAFRARLDNPRSGQKLFAQGGYSGQLLARGGTVELVDGLRSVSTLTLPATPTPAQQFLRISEILFAPPPPPIGSPWQSDDFEFIEFVHTGAEPLDLSHVFVSGAVNFDFASGSRQRLEPGQRCVIVRNADAFRSCYGAIAAIAGIYSGRLSDSDERIQVRELGEVVIDFSYKASWSDKAAHDGYSLVTVNDRAEWTAWNDKSQWSAGIVQGGTPGIADDVYSKWLSTYFPPGDLSQSSLLPFSANPDHDNYSNADEFTLGSDPHDAASPLFIETVSLAADGAVNIRFPVLANRRYRLERRDGVDRPDAWQSVEEVSRPTAGSVELIDRPASEISRRFYRVIAFKTP
ncbi:MAG: hypothetical protein EXS36_08105 [Pedosphaera sp.]|nr:hypothetical protein [Pedosphaera sp.]